MPTRPRPDGATKSTTIDHVFVRRATLLETTVIDVRGLSDHNLVVARLRVDDGLAWCRDPAAPWSPGHPRPSRAASSRSAAGAKLPAMRIALLGSALAALNASARGQTTWTVPNAAPVQPFIAAAAPGDILVLGQTHPAFTLDKGLTLRPALNGSVVQLTAESWTIPPNQQATIVDVSISSAGTGPSGPCLTIAGAVTFLRCSMFPIVAPGAPPYGIYLTQGSLTLLGCSILAPTYGPARVTPLRIDGGFCSAIDCEFRGAAATSGLPGILPTSAVELRGGQFVASHCTMSAGGSGSFFILPLGPVPAMQVLGGTAYLTDCTLIGAAWPGPPLPAGPGAAALAVVAGAAQVGRCTLTPGSGTPSGPPTSGNVVAAPAMVGISMPAPLQVGGAATVTAMGGASGQLLVLAFWPALSPNVLAPVIEPLWGSAALGFAAFAATPAPSAAVPFSFVVPNVPSLVDGAAWFQALQLDGTVVRASGVAGGTIR